MQGFFFFLLPPLIDAAEITFYLKKKKKKSCSLLTVCFDFHLTVLFNSCLARSLALPANNITLILRATRRVFEWELNLERRNTLPTRGALQVYFQSASSVFRLVMRARRQAIHLPRTVGRLPGKMSAALKKCCAVCRCRGGGEEGGFLQVLVITIFASLHIHT